MSLNVEHVPAAEDVYHLKLALHRRAHRHPLLYVMLGGAASVAAGGGMMASVGSPAWWTLSLVGAAFAAATWLATRINVPTPATVERQFRAFTWMRDPFRVELDEQGVRYEHGPYRSRAAWPAFAGWAETDHHLVLMESRGPGSLAYGLSKRELDRTPGGAAAWRAHLSAHLGGSRRVHGG